MELLDYYANFCGTHSYGLALQIQAYQEEMSTYTLYGQIPPAPPHIREMDGLYSVLLHAQDNDDLHDLYLEADKMLMKDSTYFPGIESQPWKDTK
jgi:hypothetical protein